MSLLLKQDQSNRVAVTLNENTTLTGSTFYLWNMTSDDSGESIQFIATDVSTNLFRYNQFNIILTGSSFTNLTAGTINTSQNGTYKYEIHQQNSNTNLLTASASGIVELGRIVVSGTSVSPSVFYEPVITNKIIYNP